MFSLRLERRVSFSQSICGISVVKNYYSLCKFNVLEIASKKNKADAPPESESRVQLPTTSKDAEAKRDDTAEEASSSEIPSGAPGDISK